MQQLLFEISQVTAAISYRWGGQIDNLRVSFLQDSVQQDLTNLFISDWVIKKQRGSFCEAQYSKCFAMKNAAESSDSSGSITGAASLVN